MPITNCKRCTKPKLREIYKILFGLTEEFREQLPAIEMAADVIAELDFINAKAVFHQKFNCVIPEIGTAAILPDGEAQNHR